MNVVSNCPQCGCSYSWEMNQVEATSDGGRRPARSPDCPKCGYDVTHSNALATRNFHYYARTDDAEAMRKLIQNRKRIIQDRKLLTEKWERLLKEWEKARRLSPPRFSNLFGLFSPRAPARPVLPDVPPAPDVNAPSATNKFNPLVIAAICGSKNAAEFFLNNGVDRAVIPLALEKAKQFGHPEVIRLLTAHL